MKILWLCNIPLPEVADLFEVKKSNSGGWLVGLKNDLSIQDDLELNICFPLDKIEKIKKIKNENVNYYAIPKKGKSLIEYDGNLKDYFEILLKELNPEVIHIWGTEFPHSLSMADACINLNIIERVVVSIQGLVSIYEKHYKSNLPEKLIKSCTFRDFLKQDNIYNQIKKFNIRGNYEVECLKKVKNVIGRTDWDRACTENINPELNYYFCNETLRNEFYKHKWNYNNCEKFSIFVSQGNYPIKGLHYMLEAFPKVIEKYPEAKLYIAGDNITLSHTIRDKIRISSYGVYVKSLIKKYKLDNKVFFKGNLDESKMCEAFLKSNIFVSASSIENSPNSVGEAMILGVPVVASYVGGINNLLTNEEEGYTYQHDAPYMLAYYICKIFQNKNECLKLSENAKKKANILHNKNTNLKQIIEIYKKISHLI